MLGSRPSTDKYFIEMAKLVATRSTCLRRSVGCVLVDAGHHVLATGYNGVARGRSHCNEITKSERYNGPKVNEHWMPLFTHEYGHACEGANAPSGTALSSCEAVHAEENALIQCWNVDRIVTLYCTASPCVLCMRKILNTGTKRIVFAEEYPHPQSKELAMQANIDWIQI